MSCRTKCSKPFWIRYSFFHEIKNPHNKIIIKIPLLKKTIFTFFISSRSKSFNYWNWLNKGKKKKEFKRPIKLYIQIFSNLLFLCYRIWVATLPLTYKLIKEPENSKIIFQKYLNPEIFLIGLSNNICTSLNDCGAPKLTSNSLPQ